ncbi:MAG: DUF4468 domain-containing protein [Cytophagaceae bacterium]|nr:DUF4468 domain-containing protein [Cytophagaceae bacterium]MDW8456591.1 DUF4468 domain-containing protein [Cytophagaceae bacterium]
MKKLFNLCLLFVWCNIALAQTKTFPIDETTQKITYTEVVNVEGVSKDELYARAKNLGILGNNIVKDNPAEGIYVYKGQINVTYPAPQLGQAHSGVVNYLVTIACKDGRYKYTITDFTHYSDKASGGKLEGALPECGKYTLKPEGWSSIKKQTMEYMDKFIVALKEKMNKPAVKTGSKDDW